MMKKMSGFSSERNLQERVIYTPRTRAAAGGRSPRHCLHHAGLQHNNDEFYGCKSANIPRGASYIWPPI